MRRVLRCFVTALSALPFVLVITASVAHAQTTALVLQSDAGDSVGGGTQQTFTPPNATFSANASSSSGLRVTVWTGSTYWDLFFYAKQGSPLVVGAYEPVYSNGSGGPELNVRGNGHSCRVVGGKFDVLEIEFNPNGTVARFAADFEQHCEDGDPALVGMIRFDSAKAAGMPFGGTPREISIQIDEPQHGTVTGTGISCGGGVSDCAESYGVASSLVLAATPDPGYLFVGWTGDCGRAVSPIQIRVGRRKQCTAWFNAIPGTGGSDVSLLGEGMVFLDGQPGAHDLSGQRLLFRSGQGT